MSPNSRSRRLDQFFPSKKKKCLSPYGKLGKANKDVNACLEGSPNAKGSLDGYLVKSFDEIPSPNKTLSAQDALKERDTVKQNLAFEVNWPSASVLETPSESGSILQPCRSSSHPVFSSSVKSVMKGQANTVEHVKEVHSGSVILESNVNESEKNVYSSSAELISDAKDLLVSFPLKQNTSIYHGSVSQELSQFANSFLRICGSELVSKEALPLEGNLMSPKLNKNKRSASPSQLSATSSVLKKKTCDIEGGYKLMERLMEEPCVSPKCSEDHASDPIDISDGIGSSEFYGLPEGCLAGVNGSEEIINRANNGNEQLLVQSSSKVCKDSLVHKTGIFAAPVLQGSESISGGDSGDKVHSLIKTETPEVLKKCHRTPRNSLEQTSVCTPGVAVKGDVNKTPGWVYRSSIFSPGDEFWDEAIQLADGLIVKPDNSVEDEREACIGVDVQDDQEDLSSAKTGSCAVAVQSEGLMSHDLKFQNSVIDIFSSKRFHQSLASKREEEHTEYEVPNQNVASLEVCVSGECITKHGKEKSYVGRVGQYKAFGVGSSSFPVRHFDFLCEQNVVTEQNLDNLALQDTENVPCKNNLPVYMEPCMDVGITLKQPDTCSNFPNENLERDASRMCNVALKDSQNVASIEGSRTNKSADVDDLKSKHMKDNMATSDSSIVPSSGTEASSNKGSPLLTCLDNNIPSLKPVPGFHSEGIKDAENSMAAEKNVKLSEEHIGLVVEQHVSVSKTPEATGMQVNNKHSTQDNNIDTPSSAPLKGCLELSAWLPDKICNIYAKKGVAKLYPWQVECLQLDGVLQRRNLVYCASTSAGKSLVAEVLLLRRVLSTGKRALLVLPYVSLCAEKTEHLEKLLDPLNRRVRSFYGSHGSGTLPKDTSVAVCTIEKANSLINRLLEEGRLAEVGIIVIDELHMVGDQSRGYLLELMLTKLRYASGEGDSATSDGDSPGMSSGKTEPGAGMQIVGMSATMPNVAAVASWLQAALYETEFRPVPLDEYIKVGNAVYNRKMEVVRTIRNGANLGGKDPEHVVELCNEVVQEGHSVLLFCSSRKACETTAKHVAKFLKEVSIDREGKDAFMAVEELRKCPAGLDPILAETLLSGVAYHHAGLTVEEREIVETCYRQGIVSVLTATSTLAAGVNLPARRVIFRQPRIGRDFVDGTRYRQMAGRAGRTGIDTKGESILICKPEEVKRVATMLNDSCPPLHSCLAEDKNGMTRAILEVVAGGIVQTANDVHRYVRCTLLNSTQPFQEVVKSAQDSLRWLCHAKFLEWDQQTQIYTTTPLGRAAFGSSLSPEESLIVLEDLARAREGFVLASDLHLVYQVTPINVDTEPDWEIFYQRFMELCPLDKSVGDRVGVTEPFLMRMAHGAPVIPSRGKFSRNGKSPKDECSSHSSTSSRTSNSAHSTEQTLRVCRRFYVALMLAKLVQEVPLMDVCEAFKVPRGMVQTLQESAGRFASMVSAFCERLGWHDLEGLISKFQNRVSFGVRAEIAELTSIPFVKAARARALYKAGLRTPQAVAEASISELVKALFEDSSWAAQDGSRSAVQHRVQLGVAKKIKNGARQIVLEQAEIARVAAFSAFRALGLNVPLDLSQPLYDSSLAVDQNQDDKEVVFHSEMIVENAVDAGISNVTVLPDASSGLLKTDIQTIAKEADTDDINISTEQRGKDNESIFIIGGRAATRDAIGTVKHLVANSLSNEKSNEGAASKDAADINALKVEEECSRAIGDAPGRENSSVAKKYENCASVVAEDGAMFAGLEFEKEIIHSKQKISETESAHISKQGPVDVNNTTDGLDSFLKMWDTLNEFCFDLHFSKVNAHDPLVAFEVHGLAVCWEDSPVYYVSFRKGSTDIEKENLLLLEGDRNAVKTYWEGTFLKENLDISKERWERVAKIMGRKGVKKITWGLKSQIQAFKKPGISMPKASQIDDKDSEEKMEAVSKGKVLMPLPSIDVGEVIDMCLVTWLLWPDEESTDSPTLEQEVKKRLTGEVAAAAGRAGRWTNQMGRVAHNGCCRRVAQVRSLHHSLWKLIISEGLDQALTSLEIPLVKVLADMENWGIGVDMDACRRARCILECKLKELEDKAHQLSGMKFSLSTPADVANLLYGHLKLPVPGTCNKGKQHPSTGKHALDLLRHHHPVVEVIKEYRTLAKLLQSTVNSIFSWTRLSDSSQIYCIHGHWLQTSTATGRLSMEEPNLQHVEHQVDFTIGPNNGIGIDTTTFDRYQINARDIFVPTQENWLFMSADYSQIELRIMAHFSMDASLISLLRKPDGDLFRMMAARWTGQDESTISEKQRDQIKKLVYGILYGMGVNTLAEQLECSVAEAAEKHERFKNAFPGVSSWLQHAVDRCRKKGYIRTLSGRKRYLDKINFGNRGEQAKAERQAVNSICQGSAADIIKMAMLKVYSAIAGECETSSLEENSDASQKCDCELSKLKGHCRLLLQIHDELLLEVDPLMVREAAALVRSSMEGAASLLVPLRVKLRVGRTWGSLEPFNEIK